jgi:hypothetical protein
VSGFATVSADEDVVVELGHKSSLMDAGFVVANYVLLLSESLVWRRSSERIRRILRDAN